MAGKKLAANVIVTVDGLPQLFTPDDEVPADVAAQLGDHVWEQASEADLELSHPKRGKAEHYSPTPQAKGKAKVSDDPPGDAAGDVNSSDEDQGEEPGIPSQAGPGSGLPKWQAYAKANGVDVADDASKADIIAACQAAGVPVEKDK